MRLLIAMSACALLGGTALAWEGCYYDDGPFQPIQAGDSYPQIEVYIDDSFYAAPDVGGLSTSTAMLLVQQGVTRFQSESGASFNFHYAGTATNKECVGTKGASVQFSTPVYIISADPDGTYCCPDDPSTPEYEPDTCNQSACSWFEEKANSHEMNCARTHFMLNRSFSYYGVGSGTDFLKLLYHEMMHGLRFSHQSGAGCPAANRDDNSVVDGTSANGSAGRHLTRADRNYLRSDYGAMEHDVIENHGSGFGPASWTASALTDDTALGGTSATDGNDASSGYVFDHEVNGQPETHALLYESSWLPLEHVSDWDSYYRPDITRSIGHSPNKWMVAFLTGDSNESIVKDVRVAVKTFGQAGWSWAFVGVSVSGTAVAVAFDPISDRFVMTYLDDSDHVRVTTRSFAGGGWSGAVDSGFTAFDGADVACSGWTNTDGHNCVLTYVTTGTSMAIRFVPFHVDGTDAVIESTDISSGWIGYSRPSVSANPFNTDPKFYYGFNQLGTTVYTRSQNRNSTSWAGGTPVVAPSENWYRPAGLGTFVSGGAQTDVMTPDN